MTLIFCDADPNQIIILRAILTRFEEVSGLRINFGKSKLVLARVVHNLDVLVGLLGCKQSSLTLKYLGLSLGAKFKELSIWNPILEKMKRRLAVWKRLNLSKGGKVTLIKVLSPLYLLIFFPFFIYLGRWLIAWKNCREIFFRVELVVNLNYIW